jgi:hypothetical protein
MSAKLQGTCTVLLDSLTPEQECVRVLHLLMRDPDVLASGKQHYGM